MKRYTVNCDTFDDLLEFYETDPKLKQLLDKHAEECEECFLAKKAWLSIQKKDTDLSSDPESKDVAAEVYQRIFGEKKATDLLEQKEGTEDEGVPASVMKNLLKHLPSDKEQISSDTIKNLLQDWLAVWEADFQGDYNLIEDLSDLVQGELTPVEEDVSNTLQYYKEDDEMLYLFDRKAWHALISAVLYGRLMGTQGNEIMEKAPVELLPSILQGLFKINWVLDKNQKKYHLQLKSRLRWPASSEQIYQVISRNTDLEMEQPYFEEIWLQFCDYGLFRQEPAGYFPVASHGIKIV